MSRDGAEQSWRRLYLNRFPFQLVIEIIFIGGGGGGGQVGWWWTGVEWSLLAGGGIVESEEGERELRR